MNKDFFNKEEVKKFIKKNRAILKERNEVNFRKDNNEFKEDTFDELSSTTLDNHIQNFIERADFLKSIFKSEDESNFDFFKSFFSLEYKEIKSTRDIEKNLLGYQFSAKTSAILILVGTFADNFGFSKFFYNQLISEQLVNSCEIALRNIDIFTFEENYDEDELTEILYLKNIGQAKEEIKVILNKFLNGLKDPEFKIYIDLIDIFNKQLSILSQKMEKCPPRLLYSILQIYLADAVKQSTTLIDKHILKGDTEKLKKMIFEKNILNPSLESDLNTYKLLRVTF
ncbi:MAG: hypothetical protein ACRC4T_25675 [Cetobacterium sp.]